MTCDLPVTPVPFDLSWSHLSGLSLADPTFGEPRRVDILLGVDVFADILCHGWQIGPVGSPFAAKTEFGWVVVALLPLVASTYMLHHITLRLCAVMISSASLED